MELDAVNRRRLHRMMKDRVEHSGCMRVDSKNRWRFVIVRRGNTRQATPVLRQLHKNDICYFHTHVERCDRGMPYCAFGPPSRNDMLVTAIKFPPDTVHVLFAPALQQTTAYCCAFVWKTIPSCTHRALHDLLTAVSRLQRTRLPPYRYRTAFLRLVRASRCFTMSFLPHIRLVT
jgi:hypothetical protein